ncbi:MAG: mannose-6-phosphate isomerase, class I [Propionibacteriaceae bacterium]|jgi:mannose-6-phosphate isomerase|nr:mannose-6-phosphate isomerase, class I [Propionibacteriaceae bacterium]
MQRLSGLIRDYAWGSLTAIPELLGRDPSGEPQAEYWLGAHPSAPSQIDGVGLDELLVEHPEWVGDRTHRAFGDHYPALLKILAADRPLSLQAHPDREQAELGFKRENKARIPLNDPKRVYRDDWPKPEMIVALTPIDGLCGFRNPAETVDLFDQLGATAEISTVIGPLSQRKGSAALAEVFLDILSLDQPDLVASVINLARAHRDDPTAVGEFARSALLLNRYFPNHPSILAALLLNQFHLDPGQAMFLPTRTLHSYLSGVGIEVMANSDNVLRGGLTNKHIDVDELIRVIDFAPTGIDIVNTEDDAGLTRFLTPTPEFALWRGDLTSQPVELPRTDACRIVLAIDGEADLTTSATQLNLTTGQAALLPFGEAVTASGSATIFMCAPGV